MMKKLSALALSCLLLVSLLERTGLDRLFREL